MRLHCDLIYVICEYIPKYILYDWIPVNKLDFSGVSANVYAIDFLIENPHLINWSNLSKNPAAINLIKENLDKVNLHKLCQNEHAADIIQDIIDGKIKSFKVNKICVFDDSCYIGKQTFLRKKEKSKEIITIMLPLWRFHKKDWYNRPHRQTLNNNVKIYDSGNNTYYQHKNNSKIFDRCDYYYDGDKNIELYIKPDDICWYSLALYCNDVAFLEKHLNKLDFDVLSENQHAISILKKHQNKINWQSLKRNPAAVDFIKENLDKYSGDPFNKNRTFPNKILDVNDSKYWLEVSEYSNDIDMIKGNLNKVNWDMLSINENAIDLLRSNIECINWRCLCEYNKNAIQLIKYYHNMLKNHHWQLLSCKKDIFIPIFNKKLQELLIYVL